MIAETVPPPVVPPKISATGSPRSRGRAVERFREVRSTTERLCRPLAVEDCVVQSMPDASPAKWHLAHTSWFFETFVLAAARPDHRPLHEQYGFLFNSYYNAVGKRQPRAARGLLSRPTVEETYRYRAAVDHGVIELLALLDEKRWEAIEPVFTLGLHHEQQHQELIVTDLKHLFSLSPLELSHPLAESNGKGAHPPPSALGFAGRPEGIYEIGHEGPGFAFDNEGPRHRLLLPAFGLGDRLVTNGEYLEFMADGGYASSQLWLADGWDAVTTQGWEAPLYWQRQDGEWWQWTLAGRRSVERAEPVCHVSFYEADAYARWAGARLPSEAEWEVVAREAPLAGNLLDSFRLHPVPLAAGQGNGKDDGPRQLYGDVWEWTQSPYSPYPGYRPASGALGEYNGKFMCNQFVLRGGSCATPASHLRPTYRNFFPPAARWQFSGIRLAKDL